MCLLSADAGNRNTWLSIIGKGASVRSHIYIYIYTYIYTIVYLKASVSHTSVTQGTQGGLSRNRSMTCQGCTSHCKNNGICIQACIVHCKNHCYCIQGSQIRCTKCYICMMTSRHCCKNNVISNKIPISVSGTSF